MTMRGAGRGAYKRMVDTGRSVDAHTVGLGWDGAVVPAAGPAAGIARDGVGDAVAASGPPARRVVVVDDADGVRDLLCLLLGTEPDFVVVGAAANGVEAIDEVVRTDPDLVLLDLAMPVLDGIGALPRIRRIAPRAVVVIFTGFSEDALLDRVLALGADALLEKGLATGPLVDQLRRLCATRRPA
ncbi:Response regulator containing a CheY-like receiver domain and an HTH DNA-binding domain [Frankia canadensis]|uniref:Response regulator containing a CheY-like receiver domain and an HTH DNA-binding domain n=1 Tax=Frankia canadensis TaxID=1836972 RepID=A0A2I2KSL2_9ACTN|nr:response regulator transcription factor [Frankia canadensis]SNQ48655.1 Response regulator containing a CheY-like receiver domain and an HTH DNA-binding domain [Frankia canadensis]SOU55945.1 Response regulator containing a CheY-like receiver domain and an HTH DNA-binding domain [Frankia canadensis]